MCAQDGSPDEQQVMDLAEELSQKFSIESLEMYDALKDVWGNANKTDFAAAKKRYVKVSVGVCLGFASSLPFPFYLPPSFSSF